VAPETEDAWSRLPASVLEAVRRLDDETLAGQRSSVSPEVAAKIDEPTYSLRNRFRYWEELVRALESGWQPGGTYFIDEYVNNLDSRDGIDRALAELPPEVGAALGQLLDGLDERFARGTVPDDGAELRPWVARLRDGARMNERWYRKPQSIPWS
jgi:hypothetical protein